MFVSNNMLISIKLEKNQWRIMDPNKSDISEMSQFKYFFLVFTIFYSIS
jgi:hypothetical protein